MTDTSQLAPVSASADGAAAPLKVWVCILCGFIYEEAAGMPEEGIAAGTRWEDVPADWVCPDCSVGKSDFEMVPV